MAKSAINRRAFLGSSAAAAMAAGCVDSEAASGLAAAGQSRNPVGVDELHPAFSEAEYQDRLRRVRERMAKDNIDLLWVMLPEGMCYLHGMILNWYQGNSPKGWLPRSGTAVHVDHDKLIHFDSGAHQGTMDAITVVKDFRVLQGGIEFVIAELQAEGWLGGTVGIDRWSYRPPPVLAAPLEAAFTNAGCTVVDSSDVMRDVRLVKSPEEIAVMDDAARIADAGHEAIREALHPGVTELEMYGEALRGMFAAGGGTPALICGVRNPRGSHACPSRKVLKQGDALFADLCGVAHRYHANTSRTYWLGDPPAEAVEAYAKNAGSFAVISEHGRAGTPIGEVCDALREYYDDVGLDPEGFGYDLGISFPPDWVGPFVWSFGRRNDGDTFSVVGLGDNPDDWVFQERMVTNYESLMGESLMQSFVIEEEGARLLSKLPIEIAVV